MSERQGQARIGLAVVGAGGWGRNLVRNYAVLADAELRYVCDRSARVCAELAAEYPSVRCEQELDPLLADRGVAALVVATDAPSHASIARRALEADKDVFVEKPLAMSSEQARKLCELADERARVLMTGHLLLYHPAVEQLCASLQQGELGDVLYLTAHRTNLGVVRADENAWWSLAPHDISVVNHLLGGEPEAVSASGGVFLQTDRGIEDVVFATLYYPNGRLAHVHASWLDPHKTRRLTVVGNRKMAVFDDTSGDQKLAVFDKGIEPPPATVSYTEGVRVRTGDIRIPALRMEEPLRRECAAFLEAVRTREAPRSDGRLGLSVVRTLEAGARSLAQDSRRVAVGEETRGHG